MHMQLPECNARVHFCHFGDTNQWTDGLPNDPGALHNSDVHLVGDRHKR